MIFSEAEVVTVVEIITVRELRGWVQAGWIVPAIGQSGPVFDEMDVARVRLVCELRGDLDVPDEAVPLVLSLLDQVHGLRREMRSLAKAVDAQPENVRAAVKATYLGLLKE